VLHRANLTAPVSRAPKEGPGRIVDGEGASLK